MNIEKKQTRFNFIDALIVLIVLAIIGAAVYLIAFKGSGILTANGETIAYTVRISGVDEASLPLFKENETVKNSSTGEVIGKIRFVRTEKSKHYGTTAIKAENGYTLEVTEHPDKYDVFVTVSANVKKDKNGIRKLGDLRILIGSAVNFKIPSFASVSYIVEVIPTYESTF